MLEDFKSFIESEKLFGSREKILLAVSGGIDSVVMLNLFYQSKFKFGIAHVNFKLRGKESDEDECFVKTIAEEYKVPCHSISFDTKPYAQQNKLSIQMAARELRYQFFEKIRKEQDYQHIATAHHLNDQIETLFINLLRKTGISGLRGMLPKQNFLIRPLLFAKKKDIVNYQKKHNLSFREDLSNFSNKYLRNKIRNQLLPVFEEFDKNYLDLLFENMIHLRESEQIYHQQIDTIRQNVQVDRPEKICLFINRLKKYFPLNTYLFELIKPYGFSYSQAKDIVRSLVGESGKMFYSNTHELLKDRNCLIIRKKHAEKIASNVNIDQFTESIVSPVKLKFSKATKNKKFTISSKNTIATLDFSKLKFPLYIRKWEKGDVFYPLGCDYKKKLSDFFIDRKVNLFEKQNTYLLCSNQDIVWIIGHQIDNRFKITNETTHIYRIEIFE